MPAIALYLVVAPLVLLVWRRVGGAVSRFAAIVLVLLPFVFTGQALVTNRAFGGYDLLFLSQPWADYAHDFGFERAHNGVLVDHVLQMAPWRHEVRRAIANHEWPLWNPSMLSGDILAASMQAAPYNPVNWIELLLHEDVATTFDASIYFFFAALFAFAFARGLECSEAAALIAAAGYSLSSGIAFFVGWPHGRAWTLLPLVLLAVRRVVRDRDLRSFALMTAAFVFLIVIGHPESMLHIASIGAVWGVFELFRRPLPPGEGSARQRAGEGHADGENAVPAKVTPLIRRFAPPSPVGRRSTAIAIAISAGILALLLTAISLLPFLEALPLTFDYRMRQAAVAHGPEPLPWHAVQTAMRSTFIPYYGGAAWRSLTMEWDVGVARVGSVILALALIAALRLWRRREVRFFALLSIATMLAGWSWWPVRTVIQRLPLFNMALNDRLGIAAAFAMSVLAAFAFDAIAAKKWKTTPLIGAVTALLTIATLATLRTRLDAHVDPTLIAAGAAAELIGLAMLFAAPRYRHAGVILLVAIAAQRFVEDSNVYPAVPRAMFYPRLPLIDKVPRDPLYRVAATGKLLVPNVSTKYGLDDVRGYASMTYYPYFLTMPLWCPDAQRVYHDLTDLRRPFLSLLGVRYAFTPRDAEPPPGWQVVADDRQTRLVENSHAIPRVFVPRHIRFIDNHEVTIQEMSAATDFADTAWVYTHDVPPQTIDNGNASIAARRTGSRFEIDADTKSATYVVINETAWPGWRAYVDNRRVKVDVANRAFLSVYVPAGKHHVRVVYLPDSFVRGRAISFATLLAIAAFALYRFFAAYQKLPSPSATAAMR